MFQRFLEQLDVEETVEGGTFLDNSLVYWGGELAMDHYVDRHARRSWPAGRRAHSRPATTSTTPR